MRCGYLAAIAVFVVTGCTSILGITDPSLNGDDDGPRVLQGIMIQPDPLVVPIGLKKQLQAIGQFSDGTTSDLTGQATFALVSGDSMTVTSGGEVRAIGQGPSTISALVGVFSDTVEATVSNAAPDHIEISIADITLRQQQRIQVKATIVFTDGATADGTDTVQWMSSDLAIAAVTAGLIDAGTVMGTATISANMPATTSGTMTANVNDQLCHPVINEVQAGSNASASDEWAEIFNPCAVPIDVSNFTLNYRAANDSGAQDRNLLIQMTGTIQPGEIQLFGGDTVPEPVVASWGIGAMQRNNGSLALRDGPKDIGTLVDSVAYGNVNLANPFIETTAAGMLDDGLVIARRPFDGNDTDDNSANFVVIPDVDSTPGTLNNP